MTKIHETYINALLADATYALKAGVPNGVTGSNLSLWLKERMTETLASFIGDNFSVVTHIETSDNPLLATGFDATVWHGNQNTEYADKTYVSFTGSEGLADFMVADVNLTLDGVASNQIVDMVNWWLKNITPADQQAQQIGWNGGAYVNISTVSGSGLISENQIFMLQVIV